MIYVFESADIVCLKRVQAEKEKRHYSIYVLFGAVFDYTPVPA